MRARARRGGSRRGGRPGARARGRRGARAGTRSSGSTRSTRGGVPPGRKATGGATSGAIAASSGSARAMISAGTRYAWRSSSTSASSPPGSRASTSSQRRWTTGPVACAMSPRIVSEPERRAPGHHAELHRRQVLRLVDDHVAERARRLAEERVRLVDERDVAVAPPNRDAGAAEQPLLALVENPCRGLREARRVT